MADEKEKRALLHEAILCKGKMSAMEKKYKEAKNALVALMEEDGDSSVETDDGRAFYKGASGTYLIDAQAISRTLTETRNDRPILWSLPRFFRTSSSASSARPARVRKIALAR